MKEKQITIGPWPIIVVLAGLFLVFTHHGVPVLIALVLAAVVAGLVVLRLRFRRFVPRSRVRSMRFRLHMRLRPGRGFATVPELWLQWSQFTAWRRSRLVRPSLSSWHRLTHPSEHSVLVGRAQFRHALRVPLEEHVLLQAGPRTYKSAALGAMIMHYPGPVVSTSSKPDMFGLTSGIRAGIGPVEAFNPMALGGIPSTIRFSPTEGATDPQVAIRRADVFASAISMNDAENGGYFAAKASSYLRAMFLAAALVEGDMRLVARWTFGSAEQAEHILDQAGHGQWAQELAELRGPAEKSSAATKSVISSALTFMNDPALAQSVEPGDFDIDTFLRDQGTLYMIASGQQETSPMAPVFACLAGEIHHRASMIASTMPGGRLDPPLLMALDEVAQICPVPLPAWLSDSGGRGVQVVTVVHGHAQMASKWGERGAQTIMDTSGVKLYLPGISDVRTLEAVSKLSGQFSQQERYQDHHSRHPVVTEDMVRRVPVGYGLVIRGDKAAVIGKLPVAWRQRVYRRAVRRGQAVASLTAAAPIAPVAVRVAVQPVASSFGEPVDVWTER